LSQINIMEYDFCMEISVCIATYNGECFVVQQLHSILQQLSSTDEIIIVDDCSTDNTVNRILEMADKRINLYLNENNIGFVKSFEKSLKFASKEIVFLSDQDDIWENDKVKEIMQYFEIKNYDFVVHNASVVDGNGLILKKQWFTKSLGSNLFTRHFINNHNMGCMMAFKNNFSNHLFPFPPFLESHDQWIGLNADMNGNHVKFLNKNLIQWFRHGNNASSMLRRSILKVILTRLKMCWLILVFIRRCLHVDVY